MWKSQAQRRKYKKYKTLFVIQNVYGSECLAITKADACWIDAVDQWCLRTLLALKLHQFVHNDEVRMITKQLNLTEIIQSWRLSLCRHIARMDDDTDAKMILTSPPLEN